MVNEPSVFKSLKFYCIFFIDLLYCGQLLKDDSSLESYGLKAGCTLHILTRHKQKAVESKGVKSVNSCHAE